MQLQIVRPLSSFAKVAKTPLVIPVTPEFMLRTELGIGYKGFRVAEEDGVTKIFGSVKLSPGLHMVHWDVAVQHEARYEGDVPSIIAAADAQENKQTWVRHIDYKNTPWKTCGQVFQIISVEKDHDVELCLSVGQKKGGVDFYGVIVSKAAIVNDEMSPDEIEMHSEGYYCGALAAYSNCVDETNLPHADSMLYMDGFREGVVRYSPKVSEPNSQQDEETAPPYKTGYKHATELFSDSISPVKDEKLRQRYIEGYSRAAVSLINELEASFAKPSTLTKRL